MIVIPFNITKVFSPSVEDGEVLFNLFQYCANSNAEDIDALFNAITAEYDKQYREGGQPMDIRMESLSSIFGVFDNIRDMSKDVERMVEAAKYHATNAFTQSMIHAVDTGLSPYTYRAMTAQRIINWGK